MLVKNGADHKKLLAIENSLGSHKHGTSYRTKVRRPHKLVAISSYLYVNFTMARWFGTIACAVACEDTIACADPKVFLGDESIARIPEAWKWFLHHELGKFMEKSS